MRGATKDTRCERNAHARLSNALEWNKANLNGKMHSV